jgi:hypothetical protein
MTRRRCCTEMVHLVTLGYLLLDYVIIPAPRGALAPGYPANTKENSR